MRETYLNVFESFVTEKIQMLEHCDAVKRLQEKMTAVTVAMR
jgi:hypothetical protein